MHNHANTIVQQSSIHLLHLSLHLADNALILGHRNSEWAGHGPILEQDIALTNIALDLIGQSRNFYQYAAAIYNSNSHLPRYNFMGSLRENISEDDLAFLRDAADFKNLLLVEQPNGDWAQTILRQFLFSAYQYQYYQQLQHSANQQLAAIAEKSLKETTYHLRWSSDWVLRLGDGTEESHQRISKAIEALYMFTGEMFQNAAYETALLVDKVSVDLTLLQQPWMQKVSAVFEEATLQIPSKTFVQQGGKTGIHSEHLGFILSEMQYLQRAYPNSNW